MRILFIINRILLFLSFFLPFFLIPQCSPSNEEKVAYETAIQDSIHFTDSINQINQYSKTDTSLTLSNLDTTDVYSNLTEYKDTTIINKENNNIVKRFHTFLFYPTKNSISGYGLAINQIFKFEFVWQEIIGLCFLLSFLFSFVGVILIMVKHSHILQKVTSFISLITFIVFFFYIFAIEHTPLEATLWGLWTSLTLNLTNLIITIMIGKKTPAGNK
jgi:hypothetical protein